MTSRSVADRHQHHAGDREQHAGRSTRRPGAPSRSITLRREARSSGCPMPDQDELTNRAKLSAVTTPKLVARGPRARHERGAGADEADEPEAADRHALVAAAGTPRPACARTPASVTHDDGMMACRAGHDGTLLTCRNGAGPSQGAAGRRAPGPRRTSRAPAAARQAAPHHLRRVRRSARARRSGCTAGSIGFRNRLGSDAHERRPARRSGTSTHHSRALEVRQALVLRVGHRAVVDPLEHPQHVDRRQDHAGRGRGRRQAPVPPERADQDQELADEAVEPGQRRSTTA